jgi:hypothetical protein
MLVRVLCEVVEEIDCEVEEADLEINAVEDCTALDSNVV